MSLTILPASGHRASTLQQSLTIVLPRHQPSQRLCGSRSVMDCRGTDNLSQPRDAQPSTSPLVSTAHQLSLFAILPISQQTPHPFCPVQCIATDLSQTCRLPSQSRSARSTCLLVPFQRHVGWRCNKSCVFQRPSRTQCIHVFGIWSIRESRFVPSYRTVQKHPSRPAVGPMRGKRLISNAPNTSSSLSSELS